MRQQMLDRLVLTTAILLVRLCGPSARLVAQSPDSAQGVANARILRGFAFGPNGPLAGVNIFDVETLNGVITGSDGTFAFAVRDSSRRSVSLAVRRVGYKPADFTVSNFSDTIVVQLEPLSSLATMSVIAGRFVANSERTAALTPIEVMTTPGGGDVNSAVKTLPGVQNTDEGSGLFVRGGDYTETKTFIDGAPMYTAYQFQAPTGSVAGTINPFLTDGITFSAGGFGARWGNVLSGVVDLQPRGRPDATSASVNATLLSVGVGGSARLDHGLGASATAGVSDLSALFALNGNPRNYAPPPRGSALSAQGVWEYSHTGSIRVFALRQQSAMGIEVDDPALQSIYHSTRISDIAVASLHDTIGSWRPSLALSTSGLSSADTQAVYGTDTYLRSYQLRAETSYAPFARLTALVGTELERMTADFDTRSPSVGYDPLPGAATSRATLNRAGDREAAYGEVDAWPLSSLEVVAGTRADRSAFALRSTADPRLSAAWKPVAGLTVTSSWGIYHQVADPAFLDEAPAGTTLPPLGTTMHIVGAQLGDGSQFLRIEGWRKDYRDLVGLTRNFATVSGLAGRASGFDVFARSSGPAGTHLRLTWSAGSSRRTDPNTRLDAPAPFDIPNSVTAVIERDWSNGWHVGVAQRLATGKPFTDVTGASYDSVRHVFDPRYSAPFASRLPAYRRADIAVSRARMLSGGQFLVIFGALQNPFNTVNLFGYTWTHDYAARVPIRSAVNRTLFVGANLVWSKGS